MILPYISPFETWTLQEAANWESTVTNLSILSGVSSTVLAAEITASIVPWARRSLLPNALLIRRALAVVRLEVCAGGDVLSAIRTFTNAPPATPFL